MSTFRIKYERVQPGMKPTSIMQQTVQASTLSEAKGKWTQSHRPGSNYSYRIVSVDQIN